MTMMQLEARLRQAFVAGQQAMLRRHRDEMQAEKDRLIGEVAELKAEMLAGYFEMRRRLGEAESELHKLRLLHATGRLEREELNRIRAIALATATERGETTLLQ